jgi:hypothetical protein
MSEKLPPDPLPCSPEQELEVLSLDEAFSCSAPHERDPDPRSDEEEHIVRAIN